jgi:Na+-driven multidrug efflux pump
MWKLAWSTMLDNVIGSLQGIVDHAMVGHYVGFTGNAASCHAPREGPDDVGL